MAEVVIRSSCSRCAFSSSSSKDRPFCSSVVKFQSLKSSKNSQFHGHKIVAHPLQRGVHIRALPIQMTISFRRTLKWWEKGLQPNMKEIASAQELVDSLLNAGDQLVILHFYSPACGGCKALHPKVCQFAERNPDVLFLQVNHEEHKSMCYSLNVHVLPFFQFYRGAHGRLCSFSCTNATIKKFKDALAKHSTEWCCLGPTRGLEESELLALAANKDLSFSYAPKAPEPVPLTLPVVQAEPVKSVTANSSPPFEDKTPTEVGKPPAHLIPTESEFGLVQLVSNTGRELPKKRMKKTKHWLQQQDHNAAHSPFTLLSCTVYSLVHHHHPFTKCE
ncbi:hypothetical protein Sjap_012113 [Stephania japonica]|uniref:Thioredoxin domain-containing protein n=1 Tax=Stephania japonica TaxID=461633 RepID=A0AAP0IVE2_9MAGN